MYTCRTTVILNYKGCVLGNLNTPEQHNFKSYCMCDILVVYRSHIQLLGEGRQYVRVHMCVCVCVCVCVFGGGGGTVHHFCLCHSSFASVRGEKDNLSKFFFFSLCSLKEKTALEQNLHIVTCYPLMVIASCDIRRFVLDSCSMTVKPLIMYDSNSFWGHFVACLVAKNLLLLRISISNSKTILSFCSFFKVPENQTLSIVSNC